jgi:hypothetical protein
MTHTLFARWLRWRYRTRLEHGVFHVVPVIRSTRSADGTLYQAGSDRRLRIPAKLDSDSGASWALDPASSGQVPERSDAGRSLCV